MATFATGGGAAVTVSDAAPLFAPLVAVTVTLPALMPLTSPFDDTVAIVGSTDDHATARPVSVRPFASTSVAANWSVAAVSIVAVDG
jgi:hypothetical protein